MFIMKIINSDIILNNKKTFILRLGTMFIYAQQVFKFYKVASKEYKLFRDFSYNRELDTVFQEGDDVYSFISDNYSEQAANSLVRTL